MLEKMHIDQFKNAIDRINSLGDECWSELKSVLYYKQLAKKEYFSKEDQYTNEYCFICNGIMRLFYLSENGGEWNKYFFIENNFVAANVDPDKKSTTNIQALTSVTLICIPSLKFVELSNEFEQFRTFFQKLTFDYLEQKQEKEIRFLSNESVDNYLYFKIKYPDLENIIPHYHIASYLGITPTQLARIRKKLKIKSYHQHM